MTKSKIKLGLLFVAAVCVLTSAYIIVSNLALLGWALLLLGLIGMIAIVVGILVMINNAGNNQQRRDQLTIQAYVMSKAAKPRLHVIEGEILYPEPIFEPAKPSKEPYQIFSWTVRKQDDGRYAVLPLDNRGNLLWDQAKWADLEDSGDAWALANAGKKALGWRG